MRRTPQGAGRTRRPRFLCNCRCLFSASALLAVLAVLSPDAESAQWRSGGGVSVKDFRFEEFAGDERLVRESGVLPGVALHTALEHPAFNIRLDLSAYRGDIDYRGRTQSGQAFDSDSRTTFLSIDLLARYRIIELSEHLTISLALLSGARWWERRIAGDTRVSGLREDWRWLRLGAGGALAYRSASTGQGFVQVLATRSCCVKLEVDFEAVFDAASLRPQTRAGWRIDAGWRWPLRERVSIETQVYAERSDFGASDARTLTSGGTVAGSVAQPDSELSEAGVELRLTYDW